MYLAITGIWHVKLRTKKGQQEGDIRLPGILQANGYGEEISYDTPWVSGLHDREWQKREEYGYAQEDGVKVPFLSQPPKHFLGKAFYEKEIVIAKETEETWHLYIELTHWKTTLYVDGERKGSDMSLCAAHIIACGRLSAGVHRIGIEIDNSMQAPYRPDGHGVADAVGATWNGMIGEMALLTEDELSRREAEKRAYAQAHPRQIEVREGKFYVDGRAAYFRGTHFGGDYPLSGHPVTQKAWWLEKMRILKAWGLNFIRCHSYCPPEAAFAAADEEGIYIQPECGMWNHFEEGIPMLAILREETERILRQFGHHPSFVLFSPSNEPSGDWYQVLRRWVAQTKAYDEALGYGGRRLYTAQTGWFYDVMPERVEGVDYLYFHRSAYGPYLGGTIRGESGWHGRDYSPSLGQAKKPVICHELGQWCAYPDFDVIHKFTGYCRPGNYEVFRENCRASGLLRLNKSFAYLSGRSQLRLYKEDMEANLRTPGIYGFELLDLRDYLGQGTALVGLLDAFWQEKGYVWAEEFRQFCGETVLLAAFPSYVYTVNEQISVPAGICHFGREAIGACQVRWELRTIGAVERIVTQGNISVPGIPSGQNTSLGVIEPDMEPVRNLLHKNGHQRMAFNLILDGVTENSWELYLYEKKKLTTKTGKNILYTQEWQLAKEALAQGKKVIFAPFLSDLGYECPPLSIKNIFWNGQMGPSWGRSLGLAIDTGSPLFRYFPTVEEGGWQWEDILARARGFCMQEGSLADIHPIVRVIDDWNRNLPLSLIWEARVGAGNLLVVSADLTGDFKKRPAAYSLLAAIYRYVSSDSFVPEAMVRMEDIERNLFPTLRMKDMTESVNVEGADAAIGENANVLAEANPNRSVCISQSGFPVTVVIKLKRSIRVEGILYVPEQRERERAAFPKESEFMAWDEASGTWKSLCRVTFRNSSRSQEIRWEAPCMTNQVKMVVHSCYGEQESMEWEEYQEGYRYVKRKRGAVVKIACLHVLCREESIHNNQVFWEKQQTSATKEIEG